MENIRKLVEVSDSCHQDITFNCKFSKINGHASFTSWDGQYHAHFQDNSTTKCQCSEDYSSWPYTHPHNVCVKNQGENFCNCDIGDKESRQDVIRIDNKVN